MRFPHAHGRQVPHSRRQREDQGYGPNSFPPTLQERGTGGVAGNPRARCRAGVSERGDGNRVGSAGRVPDQPRLRPRSAAPILREVRARFPSLWLGVNFLAVTGRDAFPVLGQLQRDGVEIDAYWADDACIDEHAAPEDQAEAAAIATARDASAWQGLYFGGTAFKKQRRVDPRDYERAAQAAAGWMNAVTTSGVATGKAAHREKIAAFRRGCGDAPLALASGVTPENALDYAADVDAMLVATGINRSGDFYEIDPGKLQRLVSVTRMAGANRAGGAPARGPHRDSDSSRANPPSLRRDASREPSSRPQDSSSNERHYLAAMAPNVKGERYAWLDPSTLYINAAIFQALVDDLVAPFDPADFDVVAGFDAMGFVLGTAIAVRRGKGFLTLRKAGKLPVKSDAVEFVNYSGRVQRMEMREPAFRPGTRVLLVDQWVETGGTMGRRHPSHRTPGRRGGGDCNSVHRGQRTYARSSWALPLLDRGPRRRRVAAAMQCAVARVLPKLRSRRLLPDLASCDLGVPDAEGIGKDPDP